MAVMIGFVTPAGLFFGGVGRSNAEALGSACDALGEDFEMFATLELEAAHDLIDETVGAHRREDPRPVAPSPAREGTGGNAELSTATTTEAETPESGDGPAVVGATGDQHGPAQDGGAGGTAEAPAEAAEPAGPECSVCGAGVTADRAEVSLEDHGTIQCRKCSVE